jgi:hypothetical protein
MKTDKYSLLTVLFFSLVLLISCTSTEIRTTDVTPVIFETAEIPEAELLDVGITIFNPGIEELAEQDDDLIIFPEIRIAESSYFPYLLMETLQSSAAWGAVRVIPMGHQSVDVTVNGRIVESNGEVLAVDIKVVDSSGRHWFSKSYNEKASHYAYNKRTQLGFEPFQNIYNKISNDLNNYRKTLPASRLTELHLVSELKFAQSFAPHQFSDHLRGDAQGIISVNRLPAQDDPMMLRVKQIRERDYLFIDTLQEYYGGFVKEMKVPYKQWRKESYSEVMSLRTMQRKAKNQKMLGAAAIIAGIIGAGNASASVRAASVVGMTGGAYVLKDGIERSAESNIHLDALQELGDSLEASIESQVIELEDRTITLSGSVAIQYQQWRKILQDIYQVNINK